MDTCVISAGRAGVRNDFRSTAENELISNTKIKSALSVMTLADIIRSSKVCSEDPGVGMNCWFMCIDVLKGQ